MTTTSRAARLGAYGVRLEPPLLPHRLVPAADGWPAVHIERRIGQVPAGPSTIDDEHARFRFAGGGGLDVIASDGRAVLTAPTPMPDEELVHPYLAPVGAAFAWWRGHEAFHAGAVAVEGRVLGIVGDKGAGKSTVLAALASAGHAVVCDDMLVVADGTALAGPRCVDLREPAARHLGVGERTTRAPDERWRVPLPAVAACLPMAGWVFLAWGDELDAERLAAATVLRRLAANRSMFLAPRDPSVLLDLATLPAWELRRPRLWSALPRGVAQLVALAGLA